MSHALIFPTLWRVPRFGASGNVVKNGVEAVKGGVSEYRTIEYSTFDMSTEMRKYKNGVIGAQPLHAC